MVHRAVLVLFGVVAMQWSCTAEAPTNTPQHVQTHPGSAPQQLTATLPDDPMPCSGPDDPACDDGDWCTFDSCNLETKLCMHQASPGCCNTTPHCDDENPCTKDGCINHVCRHAPVPGMVCCSEDSDCEDGLPCTNDLCTQGICQHTVSQGPLCCSSHSDCTPGGKWDDLDDCTYDWCDNHKCKHVNNPYYCDVNLPPELACPDDGNPCTVPECDECWCKQVWVQGCCLEDAHCDDNNPTNIDACNAATQQCIYTDLPEHCGADWVCDDGNPCNVDVCVNNKCRHYEDPDLMADCCMVDEDCEDDSACTIEYCDTDLELCIVSLVPDQDPPCCWTADDCDDDDPFTIDKCTGYQCANEPCPSLCNPNNPCNDNNICTNDPCVIVDNPEATPGCVATMCLYQKIPGCCMQDDDCTESDLTDGEYCTADVCNLETNVCEFIPIPGCCEEPAECDDADPCTDDYCIAHMCKHVKPEPSCCDTAQDCDDNNVCTIDACDLELGQCTHAADMANPDHECCETNADCVPEDGPWPHHIHVCYNSICGHVPVDASCSPESAALDCSDDNPCTCDMCYGNKCVNLPPDLAPASCGLPDDCCTDDDDCVPPADCMTAWCASGGQCAYGFDPACGLPIPYVQNFNACQKTDEIGWTVLDLGAPVEDNWKCVSSGPLGPDNHMRFVWNPVQSKPFDSFLVTPPLDASGMDAAVLQFDREFDHYSGELELGIFVLKDANQDGPSPDDAFAPLWTGQPVSQDIAAETVTLQVPKGHLGQHTYFAFQVKGSNTYQVDHYDLDNFALCPGHAPEFINDDLSTTVAPGEYSEVIFSAMDPDDDELEFYLMSGPSFVSVSQTTLDPASGHWAASLELSPGPDEPAGVHEFTVRLTDGCVKIDTTVTVHVNPPQGWLVWCPKPVPSSHCKPIEQGITKTGRYAFIAADLEEAGPLAQFDGVFGCLGVYGNKHVLTEGQAKLLTDYLDGGGKLYLEGGDTWAFDNWTELHPYFSVEPVSDGEQLLDGPLEGRHYLYGAVAEVSLDVTLNNFLDLIDREFGSGAVPILVDSVFEGRSAVVAHEEATAGYRTVASSVPFAALVGDQAQTMLVKILEFLESGWPACEVHDECDDSVVCTMDACFKSACINGAISDCIDCKDDRNCPVHEACVSNNGLCDQIPHDFMYFSGDTPVSFGSSGPIQLMSTIVVPENVALGDVQVQVQIAHFSPGSVSLFLEHNNMTALLSTHDETMVGDGLYQTYDMGAGAPWYPTPLSVFYGESMAGSWTLTVDDALGLFPAVLLEWRLFVSAE